jgi:hypothetical protein
VASDPDLAGWYRFGPDQAALGAPVFVGHLDSDTGALGEFAARHDVRPGDRVDVRRGGAEPAVHRVVARSTVAKDELASSTFRRTGPPVLTLITCAPPFVPDEGGCQATRSKRRSLSRSETGERAQEAAVAHVEPSHLVEIALRNDGAVSDVPAMRHIAACVRCREELQRMEDVVAAARRVEASDLPTAPPERVWQWIIAEIVTERAD